MSIMELWNIREIIPRDFMSSLMNIHSTQTAKVISFINRPNGYFLENNSFSITDPNEINAYYIRDLNPIVIPSGILQYPVFINSVESLNYGAVGSILGHELMHGIDNEEQIDGNPTLSENIADDTEGLRFAFYAYKDYFTEYGFELALPAFENLSRRQLLLMSFANIYCVEENKFHKKLMMNDEHSPQNSRVIAVPCQIYLNLLKPGTVNPMYL